MLNLAGSDVGANVRERKSDGWAEATELLVSFQDDACAQPKEFICRFPWEGGVLVHAVHGAGGRRREVEVSWGIREQLRDLPA